MTVLEILQKRKEIYENDLRKTTIRPEVKAETQARIAELENLIFIIATQPITEIQ